MEYIDREDTRKKLTDVIQSEAKSMIDRDKFQSLAYNRLLAEIKK